MLAFSPVMVLLVTFPLTRVLPTGGSLAPSVQYRTWSFKQSERSRSPHSRQARRGREGDGNINGYTAGSSSDSIGGTTATTRVRYL